MTESTVKRFVSYRCGGDLGLYPEEHKRCRGEAYSSVDVQWVPCQCDCHKVMPEDEPNKVIEPQPETITIDAYALKRLTNAVYKLWEQLNGIIYGQPPLVTEETLTDELYSLDEKTMEEVESLHHSYLGQERSTVGEEPMPPWVQSKEME